MHNLSLSGCGFLGIYHIGVVSAFREHAPEYLIDKISGCSAGSLVAACAICDCCLGQMVSDVLEIALKARSHALGPLHPSFNIVEILKNGLRRILPVDAHKICTNRLHVSITRWKDGKNFLVNKFDSREELIQALICSSFVPAYSGIIPPKFRGVYYWDGGLSNNNPILDEDTILVSPFHGESDICPREESSAFYCIDFQGTNIKWSYENVYRISKALFPPHPEVLKAICFRGYKDGISFLKSRNLLQCSCDIPREKISISKLMGEDMDEEYLFNDEYENDISYDSEEDKIIQYANSNEPLTYKEMPPAVYKILDAACEDNKGIFNFFYQSHLSRAISIMFIPWTLPVEFSVGFTRKLIEYIPKIKVTKNPTNPIDVLLIYLNFIIQKLTYDKYQYHKRVVCKPCIQGPSSKQNLNNPSAKPNCKHTNEACHTHHDTANEVKMCARHRVPSLSSHRQLSTSSLTKWHNTTKHHHKRTRSHLSNTSGGTSNDYNKHETHSNGSRRRRFQSVKYKKLEIIKSSSADGFNKMRKVSNETTNEDCQKNQQVQVMDVKIGPEIKESLKVKFDLNSLENYDQNNRSTESQNFSVEEELTEELNKSRSMENLDNLTDDKKTAINNSPTKLDTSDKINWDDYWDKLESNVLGLDP